MEGSIVILDFGGQYAHLIASRVRRFGYYSEIREAGTPAIELRGAAGIILSGGPQSVYEAGSPQADPAILQLGIPILGLCYGHQWLAHTLGGKVQPGKVKEYGPVKLSILERDIVPLKSLPHTFTVWMSHGDEVTVLPKGFVRTASTDACANAAMADVQRKIFGLQYHIEVTHSQHGMDMLRAFVELCTPAPWSLSGYGERIAKYVRKEVGDRNVFMLVSGGVDSTVAFTLLNKTLGKNRVAGLLVDTGLMRKDEVQKIRAAFDKLGIDNLHIVDASEEFFAKLKGVTDPEQKRAVIGSTFLDVQKRVSASMNLRIEDGWMLGQGTIYPDTIETGGTKHADQIKTHHNRIDLITKMIEKGLVVEPLKELYKDEVRQLGEELGLPHDLVWRHPFPGPGLGVRILCDPQGSAIRPDEKPAVDDPYAILPVRSVGVQGDGRTYRHALALFSPDRYPSQRHMELANLVPNANKSVNRVLMCTSHGDLQKPTFVVGNITRELADVLREADDIVDQEMRSAGLYESIWQFPVVLLPIGLTSTTRSIVLRPIASTDAMTASPVVPPKPVIERMTERIRAIPGIDMVFLDLTSKPPATIEWE